MKSTQLSLSLLHLEMGNQQHHLHSSTTPHLYIPSWLYFHLYSPISYPCNIRTNMNITQTCMHAFIHPHQRHIDHPILLFPPMHIHSQLTKINNTNQNGNTSWFVSLWSLSLSLSLSLPLTGKTKKPNQHSWDSPESDYIITFRRYLKFWERKR